MNFKPYADRILSDLSDKFQLLCLDAPVDLQIKRELLAVARGGGADAEAGESFTEVLQEGFGIIYVSIDPGATIWGDRLDFIQLEFPRDLFDNFGLDGTLLFNESVDERVFAEQINDTRDAERIEINHIHGLRAEDGFRSCTSCRQTFGDVLVSLFLGQRSGFAAEHDTLPQLA